MTRIAALAATGFAAALVVATVPVAPPASAAPSRSDLAVSVVTISPWTPVTSKSEKQLSITVQLSNTTGTDIDHVVLGAGRGNPVDGARSDPVSIQSKLDSSLANRTLPSSLIPIPARPAVRSGIDVPAGATRYATFTTTTNAAYPYRGLCLCANAVYPIYLSATDTRTGQLEGFTRTYVTSVDGAKDSPGGTHLQKVGVSWVWPLIDRPHRLAAGRVFTDRDLLAEIGTDGRLTRALQVAQDIGSTTDIPMTVVLDPELVDEVAILSQGNYTIPSTAGRTVAGTRSVAARTWLTQLRSVLADRNISVEFTPYADPDVQSLTSEGLRWHTQLPATMLKRVQQALGTTTITSTLSWPPSGAVSKRTLSGIAAAGATSVLLDDSSVRPTNLNGVPTSTATLRTPVGALRAALTSPAMQNDVAEAVDGPDADLSRLPPLLAELALRAVERPFDARVAFLAAPRYVDPDVAAADTVIQETTTSAFSRPLSFADALDAGTSSGSTDARTRHLSDSTPRLAPAILRTAHELSMTLPALRSLLTDGNQSTDALPLLTDLERGLQRIESGAYLSSSSISTPAAGVRLADRLRRQVSGLMAGVHIVRPASGHHGYTYTLASSPSPLPITVENTLPYRAYVRITIATAGGLPGFRTKDIGVQSIAPESKQTFRVPAFVQRSGHIALIATLTTADGNRLGPQVHVNVHSTVFGTIGVVITVVAVVVLLLALALRYVRRLHRLRLKRRASPDDRRVPAKVST